MGGRPTCGKLVKMLLDAYQDERGADIFYTQLLAMSDDFEVVDAVAEARRDERRHAKIIAMLIKRITGHEPPEVNPYHPRVENLTEGIREALSDEEEAIRFYKQIIDSAKRTDVRMAFEEIREDEIVHAEKFAAVLAELEEEDPPAGTCGN